MSKTNFYNIPSHWKFIAKEQPSENRNKRKYAITMAPGKSKETSIPLYYLYKTIDLSRYKQNLKESLKTKSIFINDKVAKCKEQPVNLLDYITIKNKNTTKRYQLYYQENKEKNVKIYPTLIETNSLLQPIKKYFIGKLGKLVVQTFQGNIYNLENTKENITTLKKGLFTFLKKENENVELINYGIEKDLINLISVKGRTKLKKYVVENCSMENNLITLTLKNLETEKTKIEIIPKGAFYKKYTYYLSVEIVDNK